MDWLAGKQVTCTGKLASMTRREAARIIAAHGGTWSAGVNRQTAFLIVGQEGWPLQQDGKITGKLVLAGKLRKSGLPLTILTEEEFLERLGLEDRGQGLYTLAQLTRILQVPRNRLRLWIQAGLIQPRESANGVDYFDFRQVVGAKTLCELARAGVGLDRIRRSLRQLKVWLHDVDQPLGQLALLEENGQMLIRLEEGLAEPSGQLVFDFSDEACEEVLAVETRSAEDWFELGCVKEDEGHWGEAEEAYRQALLVGGPDAEVVFNLANVLYAQDQKAQAGERFRQVIEMDPGHAEAWNNLGIVLIQLDQPQQAETALRHAVDLRHADAHYNLADLLETLDRMVEARQHWQAYLTAQPAGAWSDYARSRLSN